MRSDAAAIYPGYAAGARPKRRRRAPVIARFDRRTRQARRVAELIAGFAEFFGGNNALTPILRANILRAAELTALAEQARAQALRGSIFDIESLTRIEGAADRATRRLGIPPTVASAEHVPLRERLAAESGEAV